MSSEDVQTNLRLPAKLKERLVVAAAENRRSLSAEVAARLEGSFNWEPQPMTVDGRRIYGAAARNVRLHEFAKVAAEHAVKLYLESDEVRAKLLAVDALGTSPRKKD